MKILVTGGKGQLARAIAQAWPEAELSLVDLEQFDLGTPGAAAQAIRDLRPEVVVNTAAWTAVDACEADPERARLINGAAVGWIAEACTEQGALLVQVSTDYVFDGRSTRPYREDDPTGPATVYGASKLLGEQEAQKAADHLILRTAWLYDAWGQNFLRTMLRMASAGSLLKVVDDQQGSPTSCRTLARQLRAAVEGRWRGLHHATCAGDCSWYGFAREIFAQAGVEARLQPCTTAEFQRPAPRPGYSVLDNSKRRAAGPDLMPDWREALAEVLAAGVESWEQK
jgi:dTDP-4-dehydrorhamnose reductase